MGGTRLKVEREEKKKKMKKKKMVFNVKLADVDTRIIPSCKKHCDFSNAVRKAIFGTQTTM
jgi:hypothetical protein